MCTRAPVSNAESGRLPTPTCISETLKQPGGFPLRPFGNAHGAGPESPGEVFESPACQHFSSDISGNRSSVRCL